MARKSNPVYYDANGNVVQPPAKKKGGCLKYALIGLLALIVIAVLASMMGGGSNSTSEGGGEAASQGETSSSDEAAKVGLGQEFTVGDWATTVESVDTPVASVGPSGFSTEAQGEFVPVQISAKNNAKEERTFFADSVKLVSADGAEYSYSIPVTIR